MLILPVISRSSLCHGYAHYLKYGLGWRELRRGEKTLSVKKRVEIRNPVYIAHHTVL